jgi:hypothetical protein
MVVDNEAARAGVVQSSGEHLGKVVSTNDIAAVGIVWPRWWNEWQAVVVTWPTRSNARLGLARWNQ